MSIIVILIVGLISTILLFCKKRLWGSLFLAIEVILILSVWSGVAPKFALSEFQIHPRLDQPQWKENNLIILLGYGSTRWELSDHLGSTALEVSRTFETARLYNDCKKQNTKCRILLSGGDPQRHGTPEAVVLSQELQSIGIPETDIILETESRNTFFNAKNSAKIIEQESFDYIVLVTAATHMRRSLMFFSFFDINPIPAPASHLKPYRSYSMASRNFFLLDTVLHEAMGIAQFHWYNFRGLNKKN